MQNMSTWTVTGRWKTYDDFSINLRTTDTENYLGTYIRIYFVSSEYLRRTHPSKISTRNMHMTTNPIIGIIKRMILNDTRRLIETSTYERVSFSKLRTCDCREIEHTDIQLASFVFKKTVNFNVWKIIQSGIMAISETKIDRHTNEIK